MTNKTNTIDKRYYGLHYRFHPSPTIEGLWFIDLGGGSIDTSPPGPIIGYDTAGTPIIGSGPSVAKTEWSVSIIRDISPGTAIRCMMQSWVLK